MSVRFQALSEDDPGPIWTGLFQEFWPAYRDWWAREGLTARPTYLESRIALRRHMPEILPLYDELCELAGGSDSAARFLSYYCPPRYLSGCSQAVWRGDAPLLVRNYDYHPRAFDGILLKSCWQGRSVIAMTDGLFGLVDGMNDAGLVVSLTFGGRREVGEGFGVPLILRYILQTCETVAEAENVLRRVPCHMSYNVTALDRSMRFVTAYLTPDRPTIISNTPVATNHQERVEWSSHARFTATVEREKFLLNRLTLHPETAERFISSFLKPPLYSMAFSRGFGTLYTAAYLPAEGAVQLRWPMHTWTQSFTSFTSGAQLVAFPDTDPGAIV